MTEEATYEIRKLCEQYAVPLQSLSCKTKKFNDRIIFELCRKVLEYHADDKLTVKYPENWKEALKERFAPEWLKRLFPVKYYERTYKAIAMFGDVPVPSDSNGAKYLFREE